MMALISERDFYNIRVGNNDVIGRPHETLQLRLGRPV
jgi:hypothetical protein